MSDINKPDNSPEKKGSEEKYIRYVPVEYIDSDERFKDDINLFELIKVIWEGRKTIVITTLLCAFLGLFVFLFGAREYESNAILIQEQQQNISQTQRLAQQFGGLGNVNTEPEGVIPPSLYPRIIESADFLLGVVVNEVEFETLELSTTPLIYFNEIYEPPLTEKSSKFLKNYTIGLPVTLYSGIRGLLSSSETETALSENIVEEDSRFLSLNSEQRRAISMMRARITLEQDGNLVTFKVNMPDAKAAAELNDFVINRIQDYVVSYRIEKYRQNLEYAEKQREDAKERYEQAQLELARFRDQNINITTNVARARQEELQNRRDVTFNVYNSLSQEVERARIRLQEETPVFNVLQRPSLPHRVASGSRLLLVLSVFLGVFLGIFLVIGQRAWIVIREGIQS